MKRVQVVFIFSLILVWSIIPHLNADDSNVNSILIVDNEGDGDFLTIQSAINQAKPGDIIRVYSGTYIETLLIETDEIRIEGVSFELGSGSDTSAPIIQGISSGDVIHINSSYCEITGFCIQNSGTNYFDAGIGIYGDNNEISNNSIYGNFYGIVINNCSDTKLENNTILSNVMDGVFIYSSIKPIIIYNSLRENGCQGIFLYDVTSAQISDNIIYLNDKDGIHLRDKCFNNIISDNSIYSNGIDGIKFMFLEIAHNTITRNSIYSNGWNGIHLMAGNENQIKNNQIKLNLFNGIHIGSSNSNLITKNTIQENKCEGIYIFSEESMNNQIYNNNIIGENVFDNGENHWDGGSSKGGNYWSYYNGTDENNDGIGDTPYIIPGRGNKDHYPFMQPLLPPDKPQKPTGPTIGTVGKEYTYSTSTSDSPYDLVQFGWDWDGDRVVDEWTDFYDISEECQITHAWPTNGTYSIAVKAMDNHGFESEWSDPLTITMPYSKPVLHRYFSGYKHILQLVLQQFFPIR